MKKKLNTKTWAFGFHWLSQNYVIGNGLKILALAAFFINIATAFNINIPYIADKKIT